MGAQFDDQGLLNTDPRFIAVPDGFINHIPTDVRGITFNRTPQMVKQPSPQCAASQAMRKPSQGCKRAA